MTALYFLSLTQNIINQWSQVVQLKLMDTSM